MFLSCSKWYDSITEFHRPLAMVPSIWKMDHWKSRHFCLEDFKFFLNQNGSLLSWYQFVVLADFRSHLKSGPFVDQPLFNHLKSRRVQISFPHRIQIDPGLVAWIVRVSISHSVDTCSSNWWIESHLSMVY